MTNESKGDKIFYVKAKDIFLLDMDGTLFDFDRAEELNFFRTLAKYGICADREMLETFHLINGEYWKRFERGEIDKSEVITGRFETLFARYGWAADVFKIAYDYLDNFANICIPFDGAREFAAKIASRGRIFIVTNGNTQCQKRHLADGGFTQYLSGVFISDEMGCSKPSKEFADIVKRNIEGFDCARAVWIGDSLTSDMKCAERAGIDFILFSPYAPPENFNGRCAKNYPELLEMLGVK